MSFCGFQNLDNLHEKFYKFFEQKVDILDLENWKKYEKHFPNTFATMYQLWLKKQIMAKKSVCLLIIILWF